MGLLDKFKERLKKTHDNLVHGFKRIVTISPKFTDEMEEELEMLLLGGDFGAQMSLQIVEAVRRAYETQGREGLDVFGVAAAEVEKELASVDTALLKQDSGPTVVSLVGVNGTGKTTTSAKLAHSIKTGGGSALLTACDTFRAAAIDQLKLWGERLEIDVIAGAYGADPAAVAHDAVSAAVSRNADYLFIDTAGRLHTKHNLMQELSKVHRVMDKQLPGAPHETLLVLDGSTGMNALTQAREFNKAVPLTGLVITKLDGTAKGGMVVAIQKELGLPVKFIGLGEQADDLQPFDAAAFARALFEE